MVNTIILAVIFNLFWKNMQNMKIYWLLLQNINFHAPLPQTRKSLFFNRGYMLHQNRHMLIGGVIMGWWGWRSAACGFPTAMRAVRESHFVPVMIIQAFFAAARSDRETRAVAGVVSRFVRLWDLISDSLWPWEDDAEILRLCARSVFRGDPTVWASQLKYLIFS